MKAWGMTLSAVLLLAVPATFAGEQFAMSDADRAMYAEMLENNPADMDVEYGAELFEEQCGGEAELAAILGISEDALPGYLAGFPRYVQAAGQVVGIDQVLQMLMMKNSEKPFKLKSGDMFAMLAYVKSLANDEAINIDVEADEHIKAAYKLGEEVFMTKRGGRGLGCISCHSDAVYGQVLRTQPLPNLGSEQNKAGATWPAYRMTKSSMRTLQRRFQGCMKNALLAVLPIGSKEMVGLEVYVTAKAKGKTIAIPGLKR